MNEDFKYVPFLPHSHECFNCKNRKDPQYVFSSIFITISIIAISFVVSFALNQALKETFEKMFPKSDELSVKWNYFCVIFAISLVLGFLIMYNLNGQKW